MKNRIISFILILSVLAGWIFGFSFSAQALYYREGQKIARVIADEGIVLLKNENAALPVAQGSTVALFGEAQHFGPKDEDFWNTRGYIPYGYGSESQAGDFGEKGIDPLCALEDAERNGEISIIRSISEKYIAGLNANETYIPSDDEVKEASRKAQTAICFFSRWGGEVFDVSRADWHLRDSEKTLLMQLTAAFEKAGIEYDAYQDDDLRGGRMFVLDENDPGQFATYMLRVRDVMGEAGNRNPPRVVPGAG